MRIFSKTSKAFGIILAVAMLVLSIFAFSACNYCAHDTEVIEKVESTCITHGTGYAYKCKKCGKLFGFSLEKGLYEISEPEELPLGGHTLSDELSVRIKDNKAQAESIWDYEVVYKCGIEGCDEYDVVPKEHLATIVPPNIKVAEKGGSGIKYDGAYKNDGFYQYNDAGVPYTSIRFMSATTPDEIELNPAKFAKFPADGNLSKEKQYNDKYEWEDGSNIGSYQRFPLYIPFDADVTRQVFYFVKNVSDPAKVTDSLTLEWNIDDGKTWSSITLAPGEIGVLNVTGTLTYDNNLVPTLIRAKNGDKNKLGKVMEIEMTGVFYVPGTVEKLDIDSMPDKLEYTEGEKFDPTGLKIYATYSDFCLGRTLLLSDCVFSCGDRPLTKNDTKVTVSYGGKKASFNITVKEGGAA